MSTIGQLKIQLYFRLNFLRQQRNYGLLESLLLEKLPKALHRPHQEVTICQQKGINTLKERHLQKTVSPSISTTMPTLSRDLNNARKLKGVAMVGTHPTASRNHGGKRPPTNIITTALWLSQCPLIKCQPGLTTEGFAFRGSGTKSPQPPVKSFYFGMDLREDSTNEPSMVDRFIAKIQQVPQGSYDGSHSANSDAYSDSVVDDDIKVIIWIFCGSLILSILFW